jgi:hypothetical protein
VVVVVAVVGSEPSNFFSSWWLMRLYSFVQLRANANNLDLE